MLSSSWKYKSYATLRRPNYKVLVVEVLNQCDVSHFPKKTVLFNIARFTVNQDANFIGIVNEYAPWL